MATRDQLCQAIVDVCREFYRGKNPAHSPNETEIVTFARGLADAALPSVNMRLNVHQGKFRTGASRLCGDPAMPASMEWPSQEGVPLAFLAQIKLSDLPKGSKWPLPERGWLYVFLGGDETSWEDNTTVAPHKVLFTDVTEGGLATRRAPTGVKVPFGMRHAVPYDITFELAATLPTNRSQLPWFAKNDGELFDFIERKIGETRSRICGYSMIDQQGRNPRFAAAAKAAGFGGVMYRENDTVEEYRAMQKQLPYFPTSDVFEDFLKQHSALKEESKNWVPFLTLNSTLYGSTGRGDGTWHFLWWDSCALQFFGDRRRMALGDFSSTSVFVL